VTFRTESGIVVPAVTAGQMRTIDRLAVEEFGLSLLQMMENAGQILAAQAMAMLPAAREPASALVAVLAGSGGNGGGGLCAARHLHNRGAAVAVLLDRDAAAVTGAAGTQLRILQAAGVQPTAPAAAAKVLRRAGVVVDAQIGYGLRGAPTGLTAALIEACTPHAARVLALDVPSGMDATTGEAPGPVVRAARTLTLALPKTGLAKVPGDLFLGDIGIPPEVYLRLGLPYRPPFGAASSVRLLPEG
jgi:NAD(P)H-hydrate epimerase